jgi:hypothetical protein
MPGNPFNRNAAGLATVLKLMATGAEVAYARWRYANSAQT